MHPMRNLYPLDLSFLDFYTLPVIVIFLLQSEFVVEENFMHSFLRRCLTFDDGGQK